MTENTTEEIRLITQRLESLINNFAHEVNYVETIDLCSAIASLRKSIGLRPD